MSEKRKVLIVDDSKIILSLHSYILETAGFDCDTALNGFEAYEMLLKNKYEILITDVNMPRMDGFTLTKKTRTIPECKDLPIIIISTEAEAKDKSKGMDAGANLYVVKPADPRALVMHVEMLLA